EKAGSVNEAKRIIERMFQPNQIGYTAMSLFLNNKLIVFFYIHSISVYCYGLIQMSIQTVELFRKIPKKFINDLAYVCVLNACSHSGLVNMARSVFNDIQNKTEIIYTTYIGCLSRATAFEESYQLILELERKNSPPLHR
ncbi:unnamed protein product, partial [Rotaria sp. Silwood2]